LAPIADIDLTSTDRGVKSHQSPKETSTAARHKPDLSFWKIKLSYVYHMSDEAGLNHGWRKVVRNLSPSWFTITMGTGIVSILLYELPYNGRWLYWLAVITFCLNLFLYSLISLFSLLRYILWPDMWTLMMKHPNQSLFLAAAPMVRASQDRTSRPILTIQGLGTLIQMLVFICAPRWGNWVVYTAWG
jgi:hypothetical protein